MRGFKKVFSSSGVLPAILALFLFSTVMAADVFAEGSPIDIGKRLELFVDDYLIDSMDGVRLQMHEPQKADLSGFNATPYMTVIKDEDDGLYRGYYRHRHVDRYEHPDDDERMPREDWERIWYMNYQESKDGIHWETPDLDLFPGDPGAKPNTIAVDTSNFSPFLDTRHDVPEEERYKAISGGRSSGILGYVSPDGIRWERVSEEPLLERDRELHGRTSFDSQNVAFWSEPEGRYFMYFRHWNTPYECPYNITGDLRSIGRASSEDFRSWTDESGTFEPPNLPEEHLYTNQTHPYFRAPHIYIALPTRFTHGRVHGEIPRYDDGRIRPSGSTEIVLMTQRAGAESYTRTFREAFIRPGLDDEAWQSRANYVGLNVVPTGSAEMSIYHRQGRRYVLRTDGFASVNASYEQGEFLTHPVIFDGSELVLNVSTSVIGSVRVEVQSIEGEPISGFTLDDCDSILGDSIEHVVSWGGVGNLEDYAGEPVRLRFVMEDSDIYSFRFR